VGRGLVWPMPQTLACDPLGKVTPGTMSAMRYETYDQRGLSLEPTRWVDFFTSLNAPTCTTDDGGDDIKMAAVIEKGSSFSGCVEKT